MIKKRRLKLLQLLRIKKNERSKLPLKIKKHTPNPRKVEYRSRKTFGIV